MQHSSLCKLSEAMATEHKSNGNGNVMVDIGQHPEATPLQLNGKSSPIDENQPEKQKESPHQNGLIFPVESIPPWYITLIYAFQQLLSTISGPVAESIVISSLVCGQSDHVFQAELIGTSVFMSGLCTFLQVTFGLRLPVIQASSFVYLPVIMSLMATPQWRCPASIQGNGTLSATTDQYFGWNSSIATPVEGITNEALWKPRMRELSGALIVASAIQVLLGCTGLVGVLMRFIGPLTIAPSVSLIGLSMHHVVSGYSSQHWGVAMSTAAVFVLVSQLLKNVQVPFPAYNRSRGFYAIRYPVFRLFPPIFAIAFGWILCVILTVTGQLTDQPGELGYRARTDTKTELIVLNKWFFFPYPGMWGFPTFSAAVLLGMMAATVCTIVESIGDYYATARACGVPPPPRHAVNRGIAMEGFGSVICGLLGAAHATTSYSQTVGFVPLTGMASRMTWQVAGVLLMAAGVFGKFGAIVATIPDPVLGGIMMVSLGMVVSVGLSNIQFVDLNGGRNLMILGTSILLGLTVPNWILSNTDYINTGNSQVDQMLMIMLGTPMFVGGFLGCLLDNTMPGTLEERGMASFHKTDGPVESNEEDEVDSSISNNNNEKKSVYDLPCGKWCCIRHHPFFTYLPFLPCYKKRSLGIKKHLRCCRKEKETSI